jgi:hypothetical protein
MSTDTPNVHATLNALRVLTSHLKALASARAFRRIRGKGRRACPSDKWVIERRR